MSFGILNLSRRDSHERPEFLEPGRRYRVSVQLEEISHRFAAGHRIRVAVSTSYWHRAWPMPERATLEVVTGASFLDLPVRRPRPEDENVRSLGPPEQARSLARTILRPAIKRSSVERDLGSREVRVTDFQDNGIYRIDDTGLEVEEANIDRYSIRDNDPLSAAMTMERRYGYARGGLADQCRGHSYTHLDRRRVPPQGASWRHLRGTREWIRRPGTLHSRGICSRISWRAQSSQFDQVFPLWLATGV